MNQYCLHIYIYIYYIYHIISHILNDVKQTTEFASDKRPLVCSSPRCTLLLAPTDQSWACPGDYGRSRLSLGGVAWQLAIKTI